MFLISTQLTIGMEDRVGRRAIALTRHGASLSVCKLDLERQQGFMDQLGSRFFLSFTNLIFFRLL